MNDVYSSLPVFSLSKYLSERDLKWKKFVIFGNFGAYNLGDEAILSGQLEDLKKKRNTKITVISRYPVQVKKLHKIKAVNLLSVALVIKSILNSDAVIVGGGGIFCKNDRGIKGVIFQLYTLGIFLLLPQVFRKKIVVWGIGIYPDMDQSIAFLCRLLLRHVSLITVRDHASLSLTCKWKLPAVLYKDNSFLMSTISPDVMKHDPFFKDISLSSLRNVGVALKKPATVKEEKKLIQQITSIIKQEYKTTRFWFYHLDTHPAYNSDYDFISALLASLDKSLRETIVYIRMPSDRHPQWLFSTFQLLDGFIALRLHASIFAYRFNLPLLGLTYSQKCSSFIKAIGKKPYTISALSHKLFTQIIKQAREDTKKTRQSVIPSKTVVMEGSAYAY